MIAILACAVIASWIGTGLVRRYALRHNVIDIPNARSSHEVATPTGGGASIAVTLLVGIALAGALRWIPRPLALALTGGGAAVAAVGWLDDRIGLRARTRLAVHFLAAAWAVLWIHGVSSLNLGVGRLALGPAGEVLAVLGIMWAINLYNFMDGIDGLAAAEAVTVGVMGGLIALAQGERALAVVAVLTAASCGGFLMQNWPPARIFMGDVGSGLLGFAFGTIAVASERTAVPLLAWVILLGVFVFDATVTLMRRLRRRHRLYDAHRHHAYQRALRTGLSHRGVTSRILVINLALGILAWLGTSHPVVLPLAVGIATALLLAAYYAVERCYPMEH
ncbi:MAG TPA: glycosyltransferase family 4 protein [Gemmatimonadales bacterium]